MFLRVRGYDGDRFISISIEWTDGSKRRYLSALLSAMQPEEAVENRLRALKRELISVALNTQLGIAEPRIRS